MPAFGGRSQRCLDDLHPALQTIMQIAIENGPDFALICGFRDRAEQTRLHAAGRSKLPWPRSKHNVQPALAVDAVPWPLDWDDAQRFCTLAGYILGVADTLCVARRTNIYRLRWGGDWDRDFDQADERFRDLPHYELVNARIPALGAETRGRTA